MAWPLALFARPDFGRGDDTVGDPHRAQISQFELFELFELILSLKLNRRFPVEQIRGRSSDSSRQHLSQQYPPPLLVEVHPQDVGAQGYKCS